MNKFYYRTWAMAFKNGTNLTAISIGLDKCADSYFELPSFI